MEIIRYDDSFEEAYKALVKDVFNEFGYKLDETRDGDLLGNPADHFLILWLLTHEGEVLGSIGFVKWGAGLELRRMYVEPKYRGRGLGHALCHTALRWADQGSYPFIYLTTEHSMYDARNLYENLGFVQINKEEQVARYQLDL